MIDAPGCARPSGPRLRCVVCSPLQHQSSSTGPWSTQNSGPCVAVLHQRFAATATVRLFGPSTTGSLTAGDPKRLWIRVTGGGGVCHVERRNRSEEVNRFIPTILQQLLIYCEEFWSGKAAPVFGMTSAEEPPPRLEPSLG